MQDATRAAESQLSQELRPEGPSWPVCGPERGLVGVGLRCGESRHEPQSQRQPGPWGPRAGRPPASPRPSWDLPRGAGPWHRTHVCEPPPRGGRRGPHTPWAPLHFLHWPRWMFRWPTRLPGHPDCWAQRLRAETPAPRMSEGLRLTAPPPSSGAETRGGEYPLPIVRKLRCAGKSGDLGQLSSDPGGSRPPRMAATQA